MIFSTAIALAILGATTTAIPTSAPRSTGPQQLLQATQYRLVANVTSIVPSGLFTPYVNDYVLTSYHTGAGTAYAVLVENSSSDEGRIFYTNGTADDVANRRSNVLSDGGTPPFPEGLILNSDGSLSVNAGAGTAGVGLAVPPEYVSELSIVGQASFYACERTLPSGSAVQVFSKKDTEATPGGCVNIDLLAQCAEDTGVDHPDAALVRCYDNVRSLPPLSGA